MLSCFSKFTIKVVSWLELHADIRVNAWRHHAICFKPVNASYLLQLVTNELKSSMDVAHFNSGATLCHPCPMLLATRATLRGGLRCGTGCKKLASNRVVYC